jgi:hypothetical protein
MSFPSKRERPKQLTRMLAMTAMWASAVVIIGGSLATTAVPSSAAPDGTNVCANANATFDPFTSPLATGTFTGCHQQRSATSVETVNLADPSAPNAVTIHWATGHATSQVIAQGGPFVGTGNPCPAGDIPGSVSITVVSGPYAGSVGGYTICFDLSDFPVINSTSVGPVVI